MSKPQQKNAKTSFKNGLIFLGGIVGFFIGNLLWPVFVDFIPWHHHTEIDVGNHNFNDIALGFIHVFDESQDQIILTTDNGDYYSYHQNKWQRTEPPTIDNIRLPDNSKPCSELYLPHVIYLRSVKVKDSCGSLFEHSLADSLRSYVLLADGSLHVWTKTYGVFHLMFVGAASLVIGMIIGGVIGKYVQKLAITLLNL